VLIINPWPTECNATLAVCGKTNHRFTISLTHRSLLATLAVCGKTNHRFTISYT